MAKSLLCVQKMAKMPARPRFKGLPTNKVIIITAKNTTPFAINTEVKNSQFTEERFKVASDIKIRDGNEKVPTKVLMPFASVSDIIFMRPAKYLKFKKMAQNWRKTQAKQDLPTHNDGKALC